MSMHPFPHDFEARRFSLRLALPRPLRKRNLHLCLLLIHFPRRFRRLLARAAWMGMWVFLVSLRLVLVLDLGWISPSYPHLLNVYLSLMPMPVRRYRTTSSG